MPWSQFIRLFLGFSILGIMLWRQILLWWSMSIVTNELVYSVLYFKSLKPHTLVFLNFTPPNEVLIRVIGGGTRLCTVENLWQTGSELSRDVSCHQDYIFSDLVYESLLNAKQLMGEVGQILSIQFGNIYARIWYEKIE